MNSNWYLCLYSLLESVRRIYIVFQSYEDGPTTSIAHILLSNDYICQVNSGRVLDYHSFNVSDHHSIIVEVKTDQNMDVESENNTNIRLSSVGKSKTAE